MLMVSVPAGHSKLPGQGQGYLLHRKVAAGLSIRSALQYPQNHERLERLGLTESEEVHAVLRLKQFESVLMTESV
jgi:hypothetical protein